MGLAVCEERQPVYRCVCEPQAYGGPSVCGGGFMPTTGSGVQEEFSGSITEWLWGLQQLLVCGKALVRMGCIRTAQPEGERPWRTRSFSGG